MDPLFVLCVAMPVSGLLLLASLAIWKTVAETSNPGEEVSLAPSNTSNFTYIKQELKEQNGEETALATISVPVTSPPASGNSSWYDPEHIISFHTCVVPETYIPTLINVSLPFPTPETVKSTADSLKQSVRFLVESLEEEKQIPPLEVCTVIHQAVIEVQKFANDMLSEANSDMGNPTKIQFLRHSRFPVFYLFDPARIKQKVTERLTISPDCSDELLGFIDQVISTVYMMRVSSHPSRFVDDQDKLQLLASQAQKMETSLMLSTQSYIPQGVPILVQAIVIPPVMLDAEPDKLTVQPFYAVKTL